MKFSGLQLSKSVAKTLSYAIETNVERHINNSRMTHRKHLFTLYYRLMHSFGICIVDRRLQFVCQAFAISFVGSSKSKLQNIQRFVENNHINTRNIVYRFRTDFLLSFSLSQLYFFISDFFLVSHPTIFIHIDRARKKM